MAQNIWDDSSKNTLTLERLTDYLKKDPLCINRSSGISRTPGTADLTPLAGACRRGHIKVVNLLLENGADANAPCPGKRTALFYATCKCPGRNRLAIVKALLKAGASYNEVYPEDGNTTPLMNAIEEVQDKEVVHALVDAGAFTDKPENVHRKTPAMLAKDRNMEGDLRPEKERNSTVVSGHIVDVLVSVVMLIIDYTNSSFIKGVTKGLVFKLYGITGKVKPVPIDIPKPETVDDFKKNIGNFVGKSGLDKFFKKDDPFLQKLAEKACALRTDKSTDLGNHEHIKRLTRLSLYQPVIYCDDSGSMARDNTGAVVDNNRYKDQRELVARIARIATKIVPDDLGVHLRFINSPSQYKVTADEIDDAMKAVKPKGVTEIGTNLVKKILEPFVYDIIADPNRDFERPILVCAITDGSPYPESEDTFKKAVMECRERLVDGKYEPTSVLFGISQIGNDKTAAGFLKGLAEEKDIQDVLYCTTDQLDSKFEEMKQNERGLEVWLLEMLTKPIMKRHGP